MRIDLEKACINVDELQPHYRFDSTIKLYKEKRFLGWPLPIDLGGGFLISRSVGNHPVSGPWDLIGIVSN